MAELESATPYVNPEDKNPVPGESVRALADYRKMFDDYRNTAEENRRLAAIDIDYYDGKQITIAEKRVLSTRGQPDIVINRVRTAVNGILGVIIRAKADPRCWGRTPADTDAADVATDVLRYVTERNRWSQTKAACFWDMLVPGTSAALITVNGDLDVQVDQIRNEEFFYDPRSRRRDFKDAKYLGIAKWMYSTDAERRWKKEISLAYSSMEGLGGAVDQTFEDRPMNQGAWLDVRNRRVMVVELYHEYDGKWYRCVFYGGGVLEEGISPYHDEKKRPCCPIEGMTAYIDRDNNRYGVVRDMRDIQDEINKRRSKLLHLVSSHQIQARDPSAIEVDADTARAEAARPDGVIPYGWEIVRTTDMSAGQMQLLAEAKNELERMGPNPAVLGRQGSDTSGRALLARQQAGLVELALVIDQLDDWELRVFKQCWYRCQQYWKNPQWIRVTENQDDPRYVQVNVPRGEPMVDPATGQPMMEPPVLEDGTPNPKAGQPVRGQPQFAPETLEDGTPNPKAGESVFGYDNNVAEMDVDIIVDTQPETANIMQEMLQDLIKLVSASPAYADQVPFEVFVELSPLPRKRMILDKIKTYQAERQKAQAAQMEMQQQAAMEKLKAEVQKMIAEAFNKKATGEAALITAQAAESQAETAAARALNDAVTEEEAERREDRRDEREASSEVEDA